MMVEGKGWVRPRPVEVPLTGADVEYVRKVARERAEYRKYNLGRTAWKRGLIKNPIFTGTLAELAFAVWINTKVTRKQLAAINDGLHAKGDGGVDFTLFGVTIDVKGEAADRDISMIRRVSDRKRIVPFPAKIYVIVTVVNPYKPLLRGWITRENLRNPKYAHRRPAKKGAHHNQELFKNRLEPMSRLRTLLLDKAENA
jgi:hypothetical protein